MNIRKKIRVILTLIIVGYTTSLFIMILIDLTVGNLEKVKLEREIVESIRTEFMLVVAFWLGDRAIKTIADAFRKKIGGKNEDKD